MYRSLMGIYESYSDDEKTGLRKQNGHYQSVKQPELHNWINELPSVGTQWNGLRLADSNGHYCQLSRYRIGIVTDGTVEPSFGFTTKTTFDPDSNAYYLYPYTLSFQHIRTKYKVDELFDPRWIEGQIMSVPENFKGTDKLMNLYGNYGTGYEYYPGACFENLIGVARWGSSGYWSHHVITATDMPLWFCTGRQSIDQNPSNRCITNYFPYGTQTTNPPLYEPYYLTEHMSGKDISIAGQFRVDFKYISKPGFKAAYFTFDQPFGDSGNADTFVNRKIEYDPYAGNIAIAQLEGGDYIPGIHGRAFSSMRQIPIDFDPDEGIIFKYTNQPGGTDQTDLHANP